MKPAQKLEDAVERLNIQKTWKERLDHFPKSRRAFCQKHNINPSVLCRFEKLRMAAGWAWINRVEGALKSEGL